MTFRDRRDAGRQLGVRLARLRHAGPVVVLALPRGGVPVAAEVASALRAPLDVLIVRKLGAPTQLELAIGACGERGPRVENRELIERLHVDEAALASIEARERTEIDRRRSRYRGGRPMRDIEGATAVVVDDGLATGATARAAVAVTRALGARRVVVAVPVGAPESLQAVAREADEVVALAAPATFRAVGSWYDDFRQVTDAEVLDLLGASPPS